MRHLPLGKSSRNQIKLNPEKAKLYVLRIWSALLLLILNLMHTSNMRIICPPTQFSPVLNDFLLSSESIQMKSLPRNHLSCFMLIYNLAQGNPSPGLPFLWNNTPQIISNSIITDGEA